MGSRLSRRVAGVENIDIQTNYNYHFPPKTGNYFSSHFFIAGERFDTPHPDGYLFGENTELKFLGNRPVQFPYLTPAPKEPVQTLRSLVNIRKDSLRLVRYKDGPDGPTGPVYGVEFIFDADAEVAITVCCQAREELTSGMPVYSPNSPTFLAETVLYRRGVNQQFSHPSFRIDFTQWTPEELHFDLDRGLFPMVLQAVVDGAGERRWKFLSEASQAKANCGRCHLPAAGDLRNREQNQPGDEDGRRGDQREVQRVCGLSGRPAGHTHPPLQTPVSLQRLCRHAALPGQQLPHLQTAL
ncbi:putative E3 ubiquitin-protein ligase MGRN1 isoform X2 [Denticeps clupeoides]|uniref:putative E3 ubiquitin-protein ligase MGRN1 isoform X2 n=1 Tax=Denticeps clupeoides TaxID=299321 RepID=UPI0010A33A1D|nr:probable E3 ubiquitin-protein ligase MGRN1 isoform X2 [Denticeps clupeoides]XP_028845515.1 probable E3 ubiquitin-protein ligase MGRN1 isoform X2 [Denticeps clupeoides]